MNSKPVLTTEQILTKVSEISENNLQQRDDLRLIIELAIKQDRIQLLEELSFQAKFSCGLLQVIKRKDSTIDEEYFIKAGKEFQDSVEKISALLNELLDGSTEFIKSILTEKYLLLSQSCLTQLTSLCSDLSILKMYFNDFKSSSDQLI